MIDDILYNLSIDSVTFTYFLPGPSQKGNFFIEYDSGIALSSTLYGPFVLDTNFMVENLPYVWPDIVPNHHNFFRVKLSLPFFGCKVPCVW